MISALRFSSEGRRPLPYWDDVPALAALSSLELAPGLNLVCGPNGSGKSTLLRALARFFHASERGVSFVSSESLDAVSSSDGSVDPGMRVSHDGGLVCCFDADRRPGLVNGSVDWSAGLSGLGELWAAESAGEGVARRFQSLRERASSVEAPLLSVDLDSERVDAETAARVAEVADLLLPVPAEEAGSPVLLCDEGDRSLDLVSQRRFCEEMVSLAESWQVVWASHSVWAYTLDPGSVNVVELAPGWFDSQRKALAGLTAEL